ncbi:MAG: prolipoprotein diacylglyceryl transferase [Synechococcales cyanobacterium RM1_1_8]|nr:prolipoprotein diacylglyceryl transferase [Synechococcales cyanobacterium RM1_1_8]
MLPFAFQFTSPGPVLYDFGPVAIRWYGLLIASAVLIGLSVSRWLATKRQVDPELMSDLVLWMVVAAIPCARLYYVLFEWQQYADNPGQAIAIWQGGIAIHGAMIGGTLAALIFAKLKQVSFWQLADLATPAVILGQAIGRWGNFFNSEAFGRPTDLPWKLYIPEKLVIAGRTIFPRPSQFADVAYYHPTFLYESLWNFALLALLLFLFFQGLGGRLKLKLGAIACLYLMGYSLGRIWIEGLRMDSLMLGPLRVAQVVSLIGIVLGGAGLLWLYGLKRDLPDVVGKTTPPGQQPDS